MAGRHNKYDTHIKPYFDRIEKWLDGGATEKQCAEALRVAYSSWNSYKVQYPEFKALCEKPRVGLVLDLRGVQVKEALGYTYEEKKTYIKRESDGTTTQYTEITQKYARPNMNAWWGAARRYDPEIAKYDHQTQQINLRADELELKKEIAKETLW